MSKYNPLRWKLQALREDSWTASFAEIEAVLGYSLPPSAWNHCQAWWANGEAKPLSQQAAWLEAGWRVETADATREVVRFARTDQAKFTSQAALPKADSAKGFRSGPSETRSLTHRWDRPELVDLRLGFEWEPLGGLALDGQGGLRFPSVAPTPGLYRFQIRFGETRAIYVGETVNLRRRFQNYRSAGLRQATNIRVRRRLIDDLSRGAEISVSVVVADLWAEIAKVRQNADLSSKIVRVAAEHIAQLASAQNGMESLNRWAAVVVQAELAPRAIEFAGDDAAYLDWVGIHPTGLILSVRRIDDPSYIVLHRATCRTIAAARNTGAYTENQYRKICALDLDELRSWSRAHGRPDGSFSNACKLCDPPQSLREPKSRSNGDVCEIELSPEPDKFEVIGPDLPIAEAGAPLEPSGQRHNYLSRLRKRVAEFRRR